MRKYLSFFFALGIMLMPHVAWADSVKPVASVSEGVRTCTFTHDHVSDFRMDGFSLYADSGKVLSSFMLSAQRLPLLITWFWRGLALYFPSSKVLYLKLSYSSLIVKERPSWMAWSRESPLRQVTSALKANPSRLSPL